jgi:colicin import membrane protein
MMRARFAWVVFCLASVGHPAAADGEGPSLSAERARIQSERRQLEAGFTRAEADCYQRFAVNDCLQEIRSRRREAFSDLRRQEVSLSDAERKGRGATQVQRVQDKVASASDATQTPTVATSDPPRARLAKGRVGTTVPPQKPLATAVTAPRRSAKPQKRPAEPAEAVARYEQKQREATERRVKRDARPAVRKKPASPPLPTPT